MEVCNQVETGEVENTEVETEVVELDVSLLSKVGGGGGIGVLN